MKTVLVTGSSGFIGRNLVERLEKDGFRVICFDKKLDAAKHFIANDIDIVINCAGEIKNPEKMFQTNLMFLYNLLSLSKMHGVKKFIHLGSSSELGNTNEYRSEKIVTDVNNWYSGTKAAATMICQGFAHEFDFNVCIARPFTIYGKYEQENRFIPTLWNAFVNDKPVHLYPGTHDFLEIDDFIDGIMLLLDSSEKITKGEIYHFGSGFATLNSEVVKLFEKAVRKQFHIINHQEKYYNYDCENWICDNEKAKKILGWFPKISLADGIKKYVDYRWFLEDKG